MAGEIRVALKFANHHSQRLLNPSRQSGEEREEGQEDQKDGEAVRGEERGVWVFPSRRWPCEVGEGRREGKRPPLGTLLAKQTQEELAVLALCPELFLQLEDRSSLSPSRKAVP